MKKYLGLIAFLSLVFCAQADEYYRSLDGSGKISYGDKPAADAADIEKIKPATAPGPNDALPFQTRRAQEKFPVVLYVADSCGTGCIRAREYLAKRGIPYTEKNLVTADEVDAFKLASGGEVVPTLNVGKIWLKGFAENPWAHELDNAGYPQTAPYGMHPKPVTEKPKSE